METAGFKKRFGNIAIEKGFITVDQLCEALKVQVMDNIERGNHKMIGTIMYEKGYLNSNQLDVVIQSMKTVAAF